MNAQQKCLDEAVAILREVEVCRAQVFFKIGSWMRDWQKLKNYKTIQAAGLDACRLLRPRGFAFDAGYFYTARRAIDIFTADEQAVLVRSAVPVTGIRALIRMDDPRRQQWIRDLATGRVKPPYKISPRSLPKRGGGSAGGQLESDDHRPLVEIIFHGDEPDDCCQYALESLFTYILRRRRLPLQTMVREALEKVTR